MEFGTGDGDGVFAFFRVFVGSAGETDIRTSKIHASRRRDVVASAVAESVVHAGAPAVYGTRVVSVVCFCHAPRRVFLFLSGVITKRKRRALLAAPAQTRREHVERRPAGEISGVVERPAALEQSLHDAPLAVVHRPVRGRPPALGVSAQGARVRVASRRARVEERARDVDIAAGRRGVQRRHPVRTRRIDVGQARTRDARSARADILHGTHASRVQERRLRGARGRHRAGRLLRATHHDETRETRHEGVYSEKQKFRESV